MNTTPQFTIGQEVITPRHGSGVVKWVYPAPVRKIRKHYRPCYAVEVRGLSNALVLDEQQLKPKLPGVAGPEVQCSGCANHPGIVVKQSVRCQISGSYRIADKLRVCRFFTPLSSAQGG